MSFSVPVSLESISRRELRQRESVADVHPAVETRRQRRERELAAALAASSTASEQLAPTSVPAQRPPRTVSTSLFAQQIAAMAAGAAKPETAEPAIAEGVSPSAELVDAPESVDAPEPTDGPGLVAVAEPAAAVESTTAVAASVVIDEPSLAEQFAYDDEPITDALTIIPTRSDAQHEAAMTAAAMTAAANPAIAGRDAEADDVVAIDRPFERAPLNEAPMVTVGTLSFARTAADARPEPRAASSSIAAPGKRRVLPARRRRSASTHPQSRKRTIVNTVVMVATAGLVATFALPAYANSDLGLLGNSNSSASAEIGIQSLTVSSGAIQDAPRDGYTSTGDIASMDSTTGTTVSPTVQALASELMADVASGKLVGSVPNHIVEIQYLAQGIVVPGCGVDYRVLQAIKVAVDNFDKVGISDINRKCTGQIEGAGTASAHYTDGGGHAVDFYILNGHGLTGADSDSLKLIALLDPLVPPGSGLGQAECRGSTSVTNFAPFDDTCTHDHIDFLNAKGVALKSS
ncbi:hypothetical protein [Subtercola sp. YIM 133946]|uniref:hypothetical protein n=1 Tax=Subtercola sp. YIM 133946 TaxID=3118909 RepID=UPI002F923DD4